MLGDPARPPLDLGRRWTYDDLAALPDDGHRYEILDGELLVSPAPRTRHQAISGNLNDLLRAQLHRTGRARVYYAPVDIKFAEDLVLEPDLIAVRTERLAIIGEKFLVAAPDLAIEILSASTAHVDRGRKRVRYGQHGVAEYWIVDGDDRTVVVHVGDAAGEMPLVARYGVGEVVVSVAFPGLACPVDDIFVP